MTLTGKDPALTDFVRRTLGCRCPDTVFEKVESGHLTVGDFAGQATRIVVGDTLLIYLIVPKPIQALAEKVGTLAETGRRDRDAHHYNRFRLVVADDGDSSSHAEVAGAFAEAVRADEKMHIHFVMPEAVEPLAAAAQR
jgi:hypothetical protein